MNKMLRLFKRTSGFTLVEMVVSVALLAILLMGMMLFITPIIRSFNDTNRDMIAENTAVCIQEYITKSIRNANQVVIIQNASGNITDFESDAAYSAKIKTMNDWCSSVNGTEENRLYELRCLRLHYDESMNNYLLYEETVKMNNEGKIDTLLSREVFSRCLYNDFYFTFDISKLANADEGANPLRDDALNIKIMAYRDSTRNNLAYVGTGITELRQIKVMLAAGGKTSDYYTEMYPAVPKNLGETAEGQRDIYIYYVVRKVGVTATIPTTPTTE